MKVIAFVGVHGSGKTVTAAHLAKKLGEIGYRVALIELEAIELAQKMELVERQVYFAATFIKEYLESYYKYSEIVDYIIYTSHPIMVQPYTDYWLGNPSLLASLTTIINVLPTPNYIVYLRVDPSKGDVDVIVRRLLMRARKNVREEVNIHYIKNIAEALDKLINELKSKIGHETKLIVVPARVELTERVNTILKYIVGEDEK